MDIIFRGRRQIFVNLISQLIFCCIVVCLETRYYHTITRKMNKGEGKIIPKDVFAVAGRFSVELLYELFKFLIWFIPLLFEISINLACISLIVRAGRLVYRLHRSWCKQRNSFTPLRYLTIITGIACQMMREHFDEFEYVAQSPVFDRDDYKQFLNRCIRSMIKRCDRTVLPSNRKGMLKRAIMGFVRKQEQWTSFVVEKLRLPLEYAHQYTRWTTHHTLDTIEIAKLWFEESEELDAAAKFRIACTLYMDEDATAYHEEMSLRQRHELLGEIGMNVEDAINVDAVIDHIRSTPQWWRNWYTSFCISNDLLDAAWREMSRDIFALASGLSEGNSPKVEYSWRRLRPSQKPTVLRHLSKMVRVASKHDSVAAYPSTDAIYEFLTLTLSEDQRNEVMHFLCEPDAAIDDVRPLIDLKFFAGLFVNWPHQEYAAHFLKQAKINKKLLRKIVMKAVRILKKQHQEHLMLKKRESLCNYLLKFAKDLRPDLDRELSDAREELGFRAGHATRQWIADIFG